MIDALLQLGGVGGAPMLPSELAANRAAVERQRALLTAHLAHVEATAPAAAAPHRAALAACEAELAWLDRRLAEEARWTEWARTNPPTIGRLVRELLWWVGLGPSPFPPSR